MLGSYVSMTVPYAPFAELFREIAKPLKSRGEAHITVGFTKRNIFEEDGVLKDSRTCVAPLS